MELGAATAEQRESSPTPQGCTQCPPCLVSLCLVSLWGRAQQRLRGAGVGDKRARQAGKGKVWEGVEMLIPHLEFLSGKFSCLCVVSIYIML